VVTLVEFRPWGDNDDPSEYAAVVEWPHTEELCPVCNVLGPFLWIAQAEAFGAGKRNTGCRRAAGEAFRRAYPNRHRAAEGHRKAVRCAAQEAPLAAVKAQTRAVEFLVKAIAEARRRGLVPRIPRDGSRQGYDGPWANWYSCVEVAQSDWAQPFIAALREAYPARFREESKFPFRDPERYAAALLRAVIARSIVEHIPLSAHSLATHALIDELHRVASRDGQVFASLWNIDDLDLSAIDGRSFDGLTFYAHEEFGAQKVVSMLMPEGAWAMGRARASYAQFGGFIYATGDGAGDHYEPTKVLNEQIGTFLLAVRLATGSTGPNRMVWMGEPFMVHIEMPEAHPQYEDRWLASYWRRMAVLRSEDLPGLGALVGLIRQAELRGKQGAASSVDVAMGRYLHTYANQDWRDTVLDMATALEAALGPSNREQIGLTIRTRAAHLLGRGHSARADEVYREITDLYTLRSDLIHGNARFQKSPQDLWEARGHLHVFETDRLRAVLDGWRDIVRRVICARLLLADDRLGSPLWPLIGDEVPVDRYMTRSDKRREWRRRLVSEARSLGLPLLIEPAPPLVDYLHRGQ
jgi:hypothetical protein